MARNCANKKILVAAFAIALACVASSAQAGFTTNEAAFDAANPGLTLLDFEGICGGGICAVPAFPGVTISGPNPVIADGPTFGAPSDWLADNTFNGFLSFAFSPTVNAVGFNLAAGFAGGNAIISIFDGITLLDTEIIGTNALSLFDTFAGFSGFGNVSNLRVSVQFTGSEFVNVDDLRFGTTNGVPEPAMLALVGLGLAGLGFARRRSIA